jgi:hypothetical protein
MEREYAFRIFDKKGFLEELKKRNYIYDKKESKCVYKVYREKELPLGWIVDYSSNCSILLIRHLDSLDGKTARNASSRLVKLAEGF